MLLFFFLIFQLVLFNRLWLLHKILTLLELVIYIKTTSKEAKSEIEIHPVIAAFMLITHQFILFIEIISFFIYIFKI